MSDDLGQVSIPAVNQYLQLARDQGLVIVDVLHQLSISRALLNDNSLHISGIKFQQLLVKLIELSGDELFGLHTAQYVQPVSYSVLGFITMNCETLGEAIAKIQPFEKLVGDMGTTQIEEQEEYITISWSCIFTDALVKRHMVDNCLASWLTFARFLTNANSVPIQVLLTRKQPSLKQCAEYQNLFKCSVVFNQVSDAIIFDKSFMALPLNKGDKQLLSTLELHAKEQIMLLNTKSNIVTQSQALILQNLHKGEVNQNFIANLLGVSAKTLQRRLKVEKTKFKSLLDQVRLQQTEKLLKGGVIKLSYISEQIGFSDERSFFRWFQKLTKMTPGLYREQAMKEKG
ncbi:MAG: AraC family transcriptional regulator [Colwellia sp.]|nr:AraC family transcriptional regulator [Colwellia sp.]